MFNFTSEFCLFTSMTHYISKPHTRYTAIANTYWCLYLYFYAVISVCIPLSVCSSFALVLDWMRGYNLCQRCRLRLDWDPSTPLYTPAIVNNGGPDWEINNQTRRTMCTFCCDFPRHWACATMSCLPALTTRRSILWVAYFKLKRVTPSSRPCSVCAHAHYRAYSEALTHCSVVLMHEIISLHFQDFVYQLSH